MVFQREWPKTEKEKSDRRTVVKVVRQLGRDLGTFTIEDLKERLKRLTDLKQFRLFHPKRLWRHLRDLEGDVIEGVGKNLWGRGSLNVYRLMHRRGEENEPAEINLDDREKTYLALCVASTALEKDRVPTAHVTAVLKNIQPLMLVKTRQTAALLKGLTELSSPLVKRHSSRKGSRWVSWEPLAGEFDHPEFAGWVADYKALLGQGNAPPATGHATLNSLVREWVLISVRATKSTTWGKGHSVTVKRDMRAVAGDDPDYSVPRAKEIATAIARRSEVHRVLGDASKATIAGQARQTPLISKETSPWTGTTYYDVPDLPGYEVRRLIMVDRGLTHLMASAKLAALADEIDRAHELAEESHAALAAIGSVRLVLVLRSLEERGDLIRQLREQGNNLSKTIRRKANKHSERLHTLEKRFGGRPVSMAGAREKVEALGLTLEGVLDPDRPLMFSDEYREHLDLLAPEGRSDAQVYANATALRRFPNPYHTRRMARSPKHASVTGFDRVDAVEYLTRITGSELHPLASEVRFDLLGPDLRTPLLPRLLLDHPDSSRAQQGLFALALLDEDEAAVQARAWLTSKDRSANDMVVAAQVLLLLRRFDSGLLPDKLKNPPTRVLRQQVLSVSRAHAQQRYLLQR